MIKIIKKSAFTLAEVLITLGIIGIVAAMTIPTLMNNTNNEALKVSWKKVFSVLSNAAVSIKYDNGDNMLGIATTTDNLRDAFLNKLLYQKKCNAGSPLGDCWHKAGAYKTLDGLDPWNTVNFSRAILNDGSMIAVNNSIDATCAQGGTIDPASPADTCGEIYIDVNGFKGPNKVSKDVFGVWVTKRGLKPHGQEDSLPADDCTNGQGWACASDYLFK